MLEAESEAAGEEAVIFAAAEVELAEVLAEPEDIAEDLVGGEVGELLGGVASGVERGDEGTHAGAGDGVDGDAVFFKPAQDADFAEGEGAAATEGETDAAASQGCRGGLLCGLRGWRCLRHGFCGLSLWRGSVDGASCLRGGRVRGRW